MIPGVRGLLNKIQPIGPNHLLIYYKFKSYIVASFRVFRDEAPLVPCLSKPEESRIDWLSGEEYGGKSL